MTLKESKLEANKLTLTTIDSQSATGETIVEARVVSSKFKKGPTFRLGGTKDQFYLAHRNAYFLTL